MSKTSERIARKGAERGRKPRVDLASLPSLDDPKVRTIILDAIACGSPLSRAAKLAGFPDGSEVWRRMRRDDGFALAVQRAGQQREEVRAEECIEIADATVKATKPVQVQAANLRVNTRLKLMPIMAPARFASFQRVEHSGPGGGPIEFANLSGDQLDQITRQLNSRLDALDGAATVIDVTPDSVSNGEET